MGENAEITAELIPEDSYTVRKVLVVRVVHQNTTRNA
jgi:hypothetical protein